MLRFEDICSFTEFQRHYKRHMQRLRKTGRPQLLTVNGRAEVVVQDAASYQRLLDAAEYSESVAAIREGLDEVRRGLAKPAGPALRALRRKLKLPPSK